MCMLIAKTAVQWRKTSQGSGVAPPHTHTHLPLQSVCTIGMPCALFKGKATVKWLIMPSWVSPGKPSVLAAGRLRLFGCRGVSLTLPSRTGSWELSRENWEMMCLACETDLQWHAVVLLSHWQHTPDIAGASLGHHCFLFTCVYLECSLCFMAVCITTC